MDEINATKIFTELRRLADEDLDDCLPEKIKALKSHSIEIRVETSIEEPEFIEDPSPYTEVIQSCTFWINLVKVYEWEETYWGSFGGMGAGWWVEQGHTSIDFDVETLLELLEMLPDAPEVPQPETSDDDD